MNKDKIDKLKEWRSTKVLYGAITVEVQGFGNVKRRYADRGILQLPSYHHLVKKLDVKTGRNQVMVKDEKGIIYRLFVDELVARCFCYNPYGHGGYVRHKDGNLQNDLLFNLEWVDAKTYRGLQAPIFHQNVEYRWWKENIYVSKTGSMLIDGVIYNRISNVIYDSDLDLDRIIRSYIHYNGHREFVDDAIRETWEKEVVHIDGDFSNWAPDNLKLVELGSQEAVDNKEKWIDWQDSENAKLYEKKFHEPMRDFLYNRKRNERNDSKTN